ncbi:MAG TPA: hypothetical protein VFS36_14690 [Chitinophagaceae bacterium]|nr:hypothetical protein [Chitinophagaceae bacterium]
MSWNHIMGYVSTAALFIPVALIILLRMYNNKSLLALLVYYSIALVCNLMTENIITPTASIVKFAGYSNNFLDAPLTLFYLLYFTRSQALRKKILYGIMGFIAFEVVAVAILGINLQAITLVLGPGIVVILSLSIRFFIQQIEAVVQHGKSPGKALMIASTLFSYGGFLILYLFFFVFKTNDTKNTFLVFYLVSTFASALLSAGLLFEKKRFRELAELKIARKELSLLYPDEKPTVPKETAGSLEDEEELI